MRACVSPDMLVFPFYIFLMPSCRALKQNDSWFVTTLTSVGNRCLVVGFPVDHWTDAMNYKRFFLILIESLQMCGSSALPSPLMKRWEEVTGHRLLERYGMTEVNLLKEKHQLFLI